MIKLLEFTVEGLPPSVNHQYTHTRFGTRLTDDVQAYRAKLGYLLKSSKDIWQKLSTMPVRPLAVEVELKSPAWFTKEGSIRRRDAANLEKAFFDAIESCVWPKQDTKDLKRPNHGFRDEMIFKVTLEMVVSHRDQTTVRFFAHEPQRLSLF